MSLLIGVVLFASLSFLSTHGHPMPLFSLEKSFMAAAFLLMGGALCRPIKTILFDEKFHLWEVGMILAGLLGLVISLKMNNKPVLMYLNEYGNYGWFFLGALSGILFSVIAGKHLFLMLRTDVKFVYYKLMMWMGFNSLVLFPIHILINVWIEKLCSVLGIGCFPLNLIAMFAFGIPICNLITYYFPWLLGQRKQY